MSTCYTLHNTCYILHSYIFSHLHLHATFYILHATLCTLTHLHMTRFTFHVGDVVSLTSENSEIPLFLLNAAWRVRIWMVFCVAGLVVFGFVCPSQTCPSMDAALSFMVTATAYNCVYSRSIAHWTTAISMKTNTHSTRDAIN